MRPLILYPDFQPDDEPGIEHEAFGPGYELAVYRPFELEAIPADLWARAAAIVCYHEVLVNGSLLERAGRCRVVTRAGVGYDNIDVPAATARGIAVCNTPDYGTTEVADHAIALALSLLRGVVEHDAMLREDVIGNWRFDRPVSIRRLGVTTFGVVGLGRIGTAAALRAKALGMRVLFHDPYRPTGTELGLGLERCDSLADLLRRCDVLSVHTPLTAETHHLIGAAELALLQPHAVLVNTGRGAVVDTAAVAAAIEAGGLAGAALDVLEAEPPPADHPLVRLRAPGSPHRWRVLLTPHSAFYSPQSLVDIRAKSARTTRAYLETGSHLDCINAGPLRAAAV